MIIIAMWLFVQLLYVIFSRLNCKCIESVPEHQNVWKLWTGQISEDQISEDQINEETNLLN